ncbi:hypothetical protein ACN27G_31250 [Plantactinospora sp. WMMB334]|uniref:hypothetical protein n=1 Tax=Plantactinospora sp. WMMB334 TaxID=3404119 RepID=UPI003B94789B
MTSLRRRAQDTRPEAAESTPTSLPLRWVVIIAVSTGVGLAVGTAAGLVAGITVGIALAALLHKVLS